MPRSPVNSFGFVLPAAHLALLLPAAVVLAPILVRAEEQRPEGTGSAATLGVGVTPNAPTRPNTSPGIDQT